MIYLANDKYRATLRETWVADPPGTYLKVSSLPENVPTIVTIGWGLDDETVFAVAGKSGSDYNTYALTGVTRLKGANTDLPDSTPVNCLNHEEFINQYLTFLGIEWKGAWDVATAYLAGEGVSHEGSSYIALVDTTGDEPPDDGIWQLVTLRGSNWSHGEGAPDNGDGIDGDFYLNETNDDVYSKAAGTWGVVVNIKGIQGEQGEKGDPGTAEVPGGVENNLVTIDGYEQIQDSGISVADILAAVYPVGSIYTAVVATNPGTLLGFGTWEAFGAGRVPVGYDSGDEDFDTVEMTGGEKEHTLTEGEMPEHTHVQDSHNHTQDSHNHTQNAHLHTIATGNVNGSGSTGGHGRIQATVNNTSSVTATNIAATATNQAATAVNQDTGGDEAHNNLQPYIVVHMWKRTA